MSSEKPTALVTGAATGIGRSVAIALANGNAEAYVELVLACRHLKRVAGLMASVPDEMVSFS